jgi:hypothetical protein
MENGKLIIIHNVKLNLVNFNKFTTELEKLLEKLAVKKSTDTFSADKMKAAAELKKTGKAGSYLFSFSTVKGKIFIQKNISEYISYTLNDDVDRIISDRLDKILGRYELEFIIQAIDKDDDILTGTKQKLDVYLSSTHYHSPWPALYIYDQMFFTNAKFPMAWENISNEDLAQMKSIKSRMVIRKR